MTESPCTKICVMDEDNRYCLGCKRTLGEIARWGEMSEAEQAAIIVELSARPSASASDIAEVSAPPLA